MKILILFLEKEWGFWEFFGTKQHGLPQLKVANLFTDIDILKTAQLDAQDILNEDSKLNNENNMGLKSKIIKMFKENQDLLDY